MGLSELVSNHTVLEAAWLRVRNWYYKGEWVPQPEFARWELNADALLAELGHSLASRAYQPSPMLLIPHAKKNGRLRHYCQPKVRDQVAFALFGVLLAPMLEHEMHPFSFGNRWYRGVKRLEVDRRSVWEDRDWSLADREFYQPYRRAHGLFRRVASWTVNAMLRCETPTESSLGPMASPEEFTNQQIPEFAKKDYWQHFPATDRVYWARFDLKLAYPSVRIERLREAITMILGNVFPTQATSLEAILSPFFYSESLRRFDSSVRQDLRNRQVVESLADYLCDLLAQVRYLPFDNSDAQFFPDDPMNPQFLPWGNGEGHPGLPTGLAISGILLNAYLHPVDSAMASWFAPSMPSKPGHPAALLRFADDLVLLAATPAVLVDGISKLIQAIETPSAAGTSNLKMNSEKSQPKSIAEMLQNYLKPSRTAKPALQEWVRRRQAGRDALAKIKRDAITEDARGPFVNELVERLSDLGMEKQADLLPEQARVRLARLQEIVVLKPDESAVPRETQLVFAANHLVRAWFPEEHRQTDGTLLAEVRRSVFEALHSASDKHRIWRAVWRIAVRRPIIATPADISQLDQDDVVAETWLTKVVKHFGEAANETDFRPSSVVETREVLHWQAVWPMYASFQRSAIWRAFVAVNRDVQWHAVQLTEGKGFAPPHSWLYRIADEQTLERIANWLLRIAHNCLTTLYVNHREPLLPWEAESLAIAIMSMIPRSAVASNPLSGGFLHEVGQLARQFRSDWAFIAQRLAVSGSTNAVTSAPEVLLLATPFGSDETHAAKWLVAMNGSPADALRVLDALHWSRYVVAEAREAARQELESYQERLAMAKVQSPSAVRRELNRYQRARQIWLASEGGSQ